MNATTIIGGTLCALALALAWPKAALAQAEPEDHARQILAEAQAHEDEERFAMAAQRYLDLYDVMHEAELPRAPVALWSAGNALSELAGREHDAIRVLRQFLSESTTLTDDDQIRDWRSTTVSLIDELEARRPDDEPGDDGSEAEDTARSTLGEPGDPGGEAEGGEGGISPVGPVLLSIGSVVLIPGLITTGVAYGQDQDLIARCPARMGCDEAIRSQVETTRNLGIAGDVLWIAGVAIALTGLVLTFALQEDGEGNESTQLQLHGAPGGAIASLRWRVL